MSAPTSGSPGSSSRMKRTRSSASAGSAWRLIVRTCSTAAARDRAGRGRPRRPHPAPDDRDRRRASTRARRARRRRRRRSPAADWIMIEVLSAALLHNGWRPRSRSRRSTNDLTVRPGRRPRKRPRERDRDPLHLAVLRLVGETAGRRPPPGSRPRSAASLLGPEHDRAADRAGDPRALDERTGDPCGQ